MISKYSLVKAILAASDPITPKRKSETFNPNKVTITEVTIANTTDWAINNEASLFIAQSVVFAIVTSVIVTLFGLNVSDFLLGVMGSDAASIALTREYLDIIFYGTFIVMIQISLNGAPFKEICIITIKVP